MLSSILAAVIATVLCFSFYDTRVGPSVLAFNSFFVVVSFLPLWFIEVKARPATGLVIFAMHVPWLYKALYG